MLERTASTTLSSTLNSGYRITIVKKMSLQQFRLYLTDSGVNLDDLTNNEKREWRETFDKACVGVCL